MIDQRQKLPEQWDCIDLSLVAYDQALELQHRLIEERKNNKHNKNILLLLEHPSVFTLGRGGGDNNLMVTDTFLKKLNIPVFQVERGGNITYHGPGQLVCYPIVGLKTSGLGVKEFVLFMEEVMIRTVLEWGVQAERKPINRGVWVGNDKLGSIGLAIRQGISFHGFALNVNTDLEPFGWINPCGLQGVQMTSMKKLLQKTIILDHVKRSVKKHISHLFQIDIVMTNTHKFCITNQMKRN